MSTTTITGTINGVNNTALANKWITFRLVQLGTDSASTVTVAQSSDSVQTDASGNFSIDIWDNGASGKQSVLEVTIDGSKAEYVIIPVGTVNIELWDLIENYQADGSTSEQIPVVSDLFLRKSTNLSDLGDAPTARTNLGVEIGTDVQAHSAILDATTASFTTADESKLDGIEALADVTDATNIAASGGYVANGTDVALTDGGTGASDASTARTNLGVAIGSNVQAHSAILDATTASFTAANNSKLSGIEALADVTTEAKIIAVGGYVADGVDVALTDGGTGASSAINARTNLDVPSNNEALLKTGNLFGLTDLAQARANLGVPTTSEGLAVANNLSELTATAATARANLDVPSNADTLLVANNLSDVNAVVARTNLSVPAASEILAKANNLSELTATASVVRTNLGLLSAATTNSSDYATAAQGSKADVAIPASEIGSSVQGYNFYLNATDATFTSTQENKLSLIEESADKTTETNIASNNGYVVGGIDVALVDGGTGASNASAARTNLGFKLNATGSTTIVGVTSYTVLGSDSVLTVDDTAIGGNVTINLPPAAAIGSGWTLDVKKTGSTFSVTIDPDGTETIDGNLTLSITDKNQAVRLISNGTNWDILSPHNINGWAIYDDLASATTPVVVNNTKHQITIDGSGPTNNVTYLPVGISSLWNTTSNKIIPAKLGDAYDIRVDFKIEPTSINDYANFILDIGTVVAPNPIINRSLTFLRTGISSFSIGFPVAAIQEFITNGGRMFIDTSVSTSNVSISDVDLFIKRDFATL